MPAARAIADRNRPDPAPRRHPAAGRELNTADLVAAARRGEPAAWVELTTRYGGMVRGVVASYRLQDADAADAMQMTWLRAFERLDKLRNPDRLGGWLATIAGRECLALLRKSRWETPDEAVAGDGAAALGSEVLGSEVLGPEALVLVAETRGAVRAAVAGLSGPPPAARACAVLPAGARLRQPGRRARHAGRQHRTHPWAGVAITALRPGAGRIRLVGTWGDRRSSRSGRHGPRRPAFGPAGVRLLRPHCSGPRHERWVGEGCR